MSFKTKAAEALTPMLSNFQSVSAQSLLAVRHVYTDGSLEKLILVFDSITLIVTADGNDDSICLSNGERDESHDNSGKDGSHLEPWKRFLERPFGWGWVTINQQGYCDGILLSFDGIMPKIAINVIASLLKIGTVSILS